MINSDSDKFIIFASDGSANEVMLFMFLNEITFKPCIGLWDGQYECSFLVSLEDFETILDNNFVTHQHCFIRLENIQRNGSRLAYLQYMNPLFKDNYLGTFNEVSEDVAIQESGFPYDITTHKYFVAA